MPVVKWLAMPSATLQTHFKRNYFLFKDRGISAVEPRLTRTSKRDKKWFGSARIPVR